MANSEDLNRLTSCSLVLLGHIFLSLGNERDSMNMVTPANQLASKIPDVHVQLWATAILRGKIIHLNYQFLRIIIVLSFVNFIFYFTFIDLHSQNGDPSHENEAYLNHCNFSQILLKDHFQSTQMPEHALIQWTDGPMPVLLNNPPPPPPSTSRAIP